MKTIILLLITVGFASAQNLNWASLKEDQKHLANLNAGVDFGMTLSAGYGYRMPGKFPTILGVEYTQPSGKKIFDDIKTRIGANVLIFQYGNFIFSGRVYGVFRTFSNPIVRMTNFGGDFSGVIGYYKPKWFVAGEAGFDKAIVTKFKHTDEYRETYPGVVDGWYQPATGGNFRYGVLAGMSFGRTDVYLNAGKMLTEDFKGKPYFPVYGRIGVTYKFRR